MRPISYHWTWHCLLICGFFPIFTSSCMFWSQNCSAHQNKEWDSSEQILDMSQLKSQGVTADSFGFENICVILPWMKTQKSKQKQFSDHGAQIIVNPGKSSEIVRNQQTISYQIVANISKL